MGLVLFGDWPGGLFRLVGLHYGGGRMLRRRDAQTIRGRTHRCRRPWRSPSVAAKRRESRRLPGWCANWAMITGQFGRPPRAGWPGWACWLRRRSAKPRKAAMRKSSFGPASSWPNDSRAVRTSCCRRPWNGCGSRPRRRRRPCCWNSCPACPIRYSPRRSRRFGHAPGRTTRRGCGGRSAMRDRSSATRRSSPWSRRPGPPPYATWSRCWAARTRRPAWPPHAPCWTACRGRRLPPCWDCWTRVSRASASRSPGCCSRSPASQALRSRCPTSLLPPRGGRPGPPRTPPVILGRWA